MDGKAGRGWGKMETTVLEKHLKKLKNKNLRKCLKKKDIYFPEFYQSHATSLNGYSKCQHFRLYDSERKTDSVTQFPWINYFTSEFSILAAKMFTSPHGVIVKTKVRYIRYLCIIHIQWQWFPFHHTPFMTLLYFWLIVVGIGIASPIFNPLPLCHAAKLWHLEKCSSFTGVVWLV